MKRKILNEIVILRSLACLSILLLHVLDRVYINENEFVNTISLLLTFGTPVFVFISEFILSYSYPKSTPHTFWKNRIKYLFLPYLCFGTFYAFAKALGQGGIEGSTFSDNFLRLLWRHILLGDYHGYFILIIFQFYVLHSLFQKYIQKFSPKMVIGISFLINVGYLSFFNFVKPLNIPHAQYIWGQFYWIPFLGWSFYFTVAFYCGRFYETFRRRIIQYKRWVILSPLIFGALTMILYNEHIIHRISSKRIDMVLFSLSITFLIYYGAMKLTAIPKFFNWINCYSFGIYLFHPFFLGIMGNAPKNASIFHLLLLTVIYFMASILLSIMSTFLINKVPFGECFVGKLRVNNSTSNKMKTIKEKSIGGISA